MGGCEFIFELTVLGVRHDITDTLSQEHCQCQLRVLHVVRILDDRLIRDEFGDALTCNVLIVELARSCQGHVGGQIVQLEDVQSLVSTI